MTMNGLNVARAFESAEQSLNVNDAANGDLVWDLADFTQRDLAQKLMLQLEKNLCIYSPSVQQMYTNFNVFFPREQLNKLVILPNPFAHFDIFDDVPVEAIRPTGLALVPNYFSPKTELLLRIPLKNQSQSFRLMPLASGLKLLNARRPPDQPLLPVLVKGDLRELEDGVPCLHLHAAHLSKLSSMSPMDVASIKSVIEEKLQLIF